MIDLIKQKIGSDYNVVDVIEEFLKINQIRISSEVVENEILNHPEYPSLLSVVDFFENFDVECVVFSPSVEQLIEGFYPCITQLKVDGQMYFSVIQSIVQDNVKYYDPKLHRFIIIPINDFSKLYRNLVFMIEPSSLKALSALKTPKSGKFLYKILLLTFTPVVIALLSIIESSNKHPNTGVYFIYNLLSYLGLIASTALVYYEVDNNNLLFRQVCGDNNTKSDCNAVLKSKGASFLGLKFSYIGFSHFLSLLFVGIIVDRHHFTGAFSLISLGISPFIIYSIYYQGVVLKSWCKFCVAVQVLLLFQAFTFFFDQSDFQIFSMGVFTNLLLIYSISCVLAYLAVINLVPVFQSATLYKQLKIAYQKAKFTNDAFWNQLKNQGKISFKNFDCLKFDSNKLANSTITIICNPYCAHCSEAHSYIEKLYARGKININLVLVSSVSDSDARFLPLKHLLAIGYYNDEKIFFEAMNDWYVTFNQIYEDFKLKYPMPEIDEIFLNNHIQAMKKWCIDNQILFTPTIFVDGYDLPDVYSVNELRYAFN